MTKPTTVINLFGGSGSGKSTVAAGLFAAMKDKKYHCELVREFVKTWAWEDKKVGPYDQVYIFGKQAKYESQLYGKVDYIITDSPLLLSAIYENHYTGKNLILPSVLNFLDYTQSTGVQYKNFYLTRNKPFDKRGRYEDEKTARKIDKRILHALRWYKIPFTKLKNNNYQESVDEMLKAVK